MKRRFSELFRSFQRNLLIFIPLFIDRIKRSILGAVNGQLQLLEREIGFREKERVCVCEREGECVLRLLVFGALRQCHNTGRVIKETHLVITFFHSKIKTFFRRHFLLLGIFYKLCYDRMLHSSMHHLRPYSHTNTIKLSLSFL